LLVSSGDDLWSVATGACLQTWAAHGMRIMASEFHPYEERIVSSSFDGLVKLWDFQGQCLHTFKGHENWVFRAIFHPTQPQVVSCGHSTVRFWCIETGNLVHTITVPEGGYTCTIAFHPQNQILASGSEDGVVRLWDDASKTVPF
jgi:WD40 repeat protein